MEPVGIIIELMKIDECMLRIDERLEDICRRVEELEKLTRQHQASTRYTPHVDYTNGLFWDSEGKSN